MSGSVSADRQASFCAVLCDEWARCGVTDAVVAPGSRSTPLVRALASQERIRVHVVLDERGAGFTALGIALSSGRPAAVVTTSGTASVELHPAIVEASQAGVPLIAATADRPPELHDVGAAQTVDQVGLFAKAVRWSVEAGVALEGAPTSWRSLAARTVAEAVAGRRGPGPVHLNLPFREPLFGVVDPSLVGEGRDDGVGWHRVERPEMSPPREAVECLASFAGRRGLVVVGGGAIASGVGSGRALLEAASRLGWPVLADPRSGCRLVHPSVVGAADALLRTAEVSGWVPDIVVRIGAPWASKVLAQWLAGLPPTVQQVLVDPWGLWADPDRVVSQVVVADPLLLMEAASDSAGRGVPDSRWSRLWAKGERLAAASIEEALSAGGPLELSEPSVARSVLAAVPAGGQLVASSSMPVRDVEWYGAPVDGVRVLANRGANGIDGVLSTAVGAALAESSPTIALLGDLAFLYDAGALLWAAGRDISLTVVVVDNDGGGIFSFLPHPGEMEPEMFERFWGTPHGTDLVSIASAYGVATCRVETRGDLDRLLSAAADPGVRVGVIRSDRSRNVVDHDTVHRAVKDAVAGLR